MDELQFVLYDSCFLELSWQWLNDPELKELTLTPDFTREEQAAWFASLRGRADYAIWGVLCDLVPIGAVGLKHITALEAEYWGYLGEKRYWGRGLGGQMVRFALEEARRRQLQSLYLKVGAANTRAIALYRRHGFNSTESREGVPTMSRPLSEVSAL
jgi:RimJ/RimL family protein N-acetyltransferase